VLPELRRFAAKNPQTVENDRETLRGGYREITSGRRLLWTLSTDDLRGAMQRLPDVTNP
jgi:hypothetical protein